MSWPTTTYNGALWYLFEGRILMPVDPSTGAPVLMLRPEGGIGVGIPPIADGPPGAAAALQTGPISFTELAASDPTPGGISVVEVSPGLYALTGALHKGADGAPGTVAFNLSGIGGSAAPNKIVRVNAGSTGFDFAFELVGDRFIPTTGGTFNTTAGTANNTVALVSIGAKNFDYRVRARGYQIVRQSGGADVQVDLYARLNGETGGNIISKCQGIGGTERLDLVDMPPAGSADNFDRVTAGNAATIHFRTEQQGGANNYTSSKTEQRLGVDIIPLR
jgi:hypothetical protein